MSALAGMVAMEQGARLGAADLDVMLRAMAPAMPYDQERAAVGDWCAMGRVAYGPDAGRRAAAAPDGTAVVFVGELWSDRAAVPPANDAEDLLTHYVQSRDIPASALNGSFAAAIVDPPGRCVVLLTDPTCSCPIFVAQSGGVLYFASEIKALTALPYLPCRPDAASIISMMACSQLPNLRTVVEGVSRLDYASAWWVGPGARREGRYWQFRLADHPTDRGAHRHAEDLRDALRPAVRRSIRPGKTGLLLSGGLDSRLILAFVDLPAQASAVAYTAKDPSGAHPLRDIAVAHRVAETAGIPFHVVRYGSGQVLEAIRGSVIDSDGGAGFAHPVPSAVWDQLREAQGYEYLVIGDECFGRSGGPVRPDDVLDAAGIRPLRQCRSLLPFIRPDRLEEFLAVSDAECDRLLRQRRGREPLNQVDELWHAQGLAQLFSAMRRNLARHGIHVHRPLLDRDVLACLQGIPPKYRLNKRVERDVLSLQSAALARLPRARFSEAVDYHEHFAAMENSSGAVTDFVLRDCPVLGEFLDTQRVAELIRTVATTSPGAAPRGRLMRLSDAIPVGLRSWLVARARYYLGRRSPYYSSSAALLLQIATVAEILRHVGRRCRPEAASRPAPSGGRT